MGRSVGTLCDPALHVPDIAHTKEDPWRRAPTAAEEVDDGQDPREELCVARPSHARIAESTPAWLRRVTHCPSHLVAAVREGRSRSAIPICPVKAITDIEVLKGGTAILDA